MLAKTHCQSQQAGKKGKGKRGERERERAAEVVCSH
jgi:hypothetical protein